MYLPVLLGGCLLGWRWALAVGVLSPVVSFLITSLAGAPMPALPRLPFMMAELAVFALVSGLLPGELVHVIADAHIYDRHIPLVKEMIERPQFDAPKFHLNPDVKDFYDFKVEDVVFENYEANPIGFKIPVAI
jgi:hypothetical protein